LYELFQDYELAAMVVLVGILAAQFVWGRIRLGRLEGDRNAAFQGADAKQRRLEQMAAELSVLKFQLHWYRQIHRAQDEFDAALRVLETWNQAPGFAGWIASAEGTVLRRTRPSVAGRSESFRLLPAAWRRLRQDRWGTFTPAGDFAETGSLPVGEPLFGFLLSGNGHSETVLFLTSMPRISGQTTADAGLLAGLCGEISPGGPGDEATASAMSSGEADLVREMLELRMLTDSTFDQPLELLQEFLKKLAGLTGFERASLYLINDEDPNSADYFSSGGVSLPSDLVDSWRKAEADWLRFQVASVKDRVILDDRSRHDANEDRVFRTGLLVPVRSAGETLGFLMLTSREHCRISVNDEELTEWAADFLLQTLDRALDRAVIEEQARRDALTNLANRRTFEQEIERLLRQAAATGSPCSLLFIDADHFKRVNDDLGHQMGDRVLQDLARIVSESVHAARISDRPLVARYGGEEFSVLLPNVNGDGAVRIAESVRIAVSSTPIGGGPTPIRMTVSIGVAVTPAEGLTPDELISRADQALYAAKGAGRNRVVRSASLPTRSSQPPAAIPQVSSPPSQNDLTLVFD